MIGKCLERRRDLIEQCVSGRNIVPRRIVLEPQQESGSAVCREGERETVLLIQADAALSRVDPNAVARRFNLSVMLKADIYPYLAAQSVDLNEEHEYLKHYLATLKTFFREAAQSGQAILFEIV